jgi:acetyltransferase-like isoleucine patch superfamily enzyme
MRGRAFVDVKPGGTVVIGKRARLFSRRSCNAIQARSCAFNILNPEGRITIGDDCAMSGAAAAASIEIGNHVLLGPNCVVTDTDGHPANPEQRRLDRNLRLARPVVIGSDVFIGANAIVLKGTVLGDGCVVAAGAVVSGRFPPRSVIVGNPARTALVISSPTAP